MAQNFDLNKALAEFQSGKGLIALIKQLTEAALTVEMRATFRFSLIAYL